MPSTSSVLRALRSTRPRTRMRLAIVGAVIVAVIGALSVVRGVTAGSGDGLLPRIFVPPYLNPDSPAMVALKKAARLPNCPAPEGHGPLPATTLPCLGGGRSVNLATLRGPLIVIMFAGWCTECSRALPALATLDAVDGAKVQFLGIDFMDTVPGMALEKAAKYGVRFPVVADPSGKLQRTDLATARVPMTYAVSRSGAVTTVAGVPPDYGQVLARAALARS